MLRRALRLRPSVRLPRPRVAVRAALAVAALLLFAEVLRVLVGDNLHEVVPGKVYRCNQPSPDGLRGLIADHGIRTVVNLRGFCPDSVTGWYQDEARVTCAANVSQEDLTLSAYRLLPPAEVRRLIDVLDRTEYPILIHCKAGADRTGLVSAMVLLLYSDATLETARRQLRWRYGHLSFGRAAALHDYLDRYEAWLAGRPHAPPLFRDWAVNHYSPGPMCGALTTTDGLPPDTPRPASVGKWVALKVRATNTSAEAWEMRPGNQAGVHVAFMVNDDDNQTVAKGQAGLFRRTVGPGESVDLTLAVPPLPGPGIYVLRADLMDATGAGVSHRTTTFYQFGNDPLMVFLEVK